jgi:glycerol uptake facilitator-like aquaporin
MRLEYLWIYLTAPFIGASMAVAAFQLIRARRESVYTQSLKGD